MSIFDVFKATQIKEENEGLKKFIDEIGGNDAVALKRTVDELENKLTDLNAQYRKRNDEIRLLDGQIAEKRNLLLVIDEDILLESFALYKPKFSFQSSDEYKKR